MGTKSGFLVDVSKRSAGIGLSGIRVIFEKAQKMTGIVRLEIGEPDFETPVHIREAAKQLLIGDLPTTHQVKDFSNCEQSCRRSLRRIMELLQVRTLR